MSPDDDEGSLIKLVAENLRWKVKLIPQKFEVQISGDILR
jgi:hypothetical protein